MKRRQISTNPKANWQMRVGAIARVMLVGAIAAGFAACQSPKTGMAANRDRSVAAVETVRPEHEHLWKQPADSEQNLRVAGQKQGVNGVREQKSRNGTLIKTLRGHTGEVWCVSFSPDGQTLATGGLDDTSAKLWKRDGKLITTLKGHTGLVWSVSFSPDGQTLATGSLDKTIKLWNLNEVASQQ